MGGEEEEGGRRAEGWAPAGAARGAALSASGEIGRREREGKGRDGEREELEASYWRGSGGLEVSRNHEHGGTDDNVVNREHHQIWTSKPRSNDRNEFC
jgi:hypothetical protein